MTNKETDTDKNELQLEISELKFNCAKLYSM